MPSELSHQCEVHTEQIRELTAYSKENRETLQRLKGTIYGNGTDGVVTRLRMVEGKLDDMPELKRDVKQIQRQMWIGIGVLIVVQPIITMLVKHLILE